MSSASELLEEKSLKLIELAIDQAEKQTSGEIRVHLEEKCREDVLDHAAYIFGELEMHLTDLRNGILIYIALEDRKYAIIGDSGIHACVGQAFWTHVSEALKTHFARGEYLDGIISCITECGEQLKVHFPYMRNDENELTNSVSIGRGEEKK
jgi:uncharacterized membrane protein